MKKILFYTLILAVALAGSSCRRAAERIRRNIRVEGIEKIERHAMAGADLTLRVVNNTGYKLALDEARVELFYGDSSVGSIVLRERVEVPRRTTMSLLTRWQLRISDPLALFVLTKKVQQGDLSQVGLSLEVKGKGGPKTVNISREKMPLSDFLNIFGLSIDDLKNYFNEK